MDADRPLPAPLTPEAKPFWDGLREGKLRGYQPGGKKIGWRIREGALRDFIARREEQMARATGAGGEREG